jgi:phospholipase/carboxylesterase
VLGHYRGDFQGTRVLVTSGDADPHVPLSRVKESVKQLRAQKAQVKLQVYTGRPHTIINDEIILANEWIFSTIGNSGDLTSEKQPHENI